MRKQDLRTGMIMKLRNGKLTKVLLNTIKGDVVQYPHNTWGEMENWNNDLIQYSLLNRVYDVMSIYSPNHINNQLGFNLSDYHLIWEREEIKEMTISEIIKELGYEVKIIEEEL